MLTNGTANDNPAFIVDYNVTSSLCSIRKISHRQTVTNGDNHPRRRPMSNKPTEKLFDVKYKVLLLGDTTVGKTSLQRYIAGRDFRTDIVLLSVWILLIKLFQSNEQRLIYRYGIPQVKKNFRTIGQSYYASTKAFVLIYDVTNIETFTLIEQFNDLIEQAGLDMERRYLIANKIDLIDNRRVDEEVGRRFAFRNSMTYFETSCKTGENIQELFDQIASDLVRQYNPKILESHRPVVDNFVFNYQTPPPGTTHTNELQDKYLKQSKRKFVSSSSYETIDKNQRFHFRRLFFCCHPRKRNATKD